MASFRAGSGLSKGNTIPPTFDHSLDNDQLAAALAEVVAAPPQLVTLGVLGTSHEGRAIPLVTVTNTATRPDVEKPGF